MGGSYSILIKFKTTASLSLFEFDFSELLKCGAVIDKLEIFECKEGNNRGFNGLFISYFEHDDQEGMLRMIDKMLSKADMEVEWFFGDGIEEGYENVNGLKAIPKKAGKIISLSNKQVADMLKKGEIIFRAPRPESFK